MSQKLIIILLVVSVIFFGSISYYFISNSNTLNTDHSKMMIDKENNMIMNHDNMNHGNMNMGNSGNEIFDESTENLPEAKKSEIVELKDGDIYEMEAGIVKQEVGNRVVKRLAYNGMIPGPLFKVEKGSNIIIKFTNNLDVETTMHSHGLRLDDSKFDGLPTTMGGEQKPIEIGGTFEYKLNFDDAGIYWYHPHIREDYTQELGLYGNFSVTEDNYWNEVDREEFIILDDFSLDDSFYKDKVNKTLMGRFGDIMMINNEEDYILEVNQYKTVRLFVTNVANTRTFDFGIYKDGEKISQKLVGGDIGRIEKEIMIESQIIAPAERYIFEYRFDKSGEYEIKSRDKILGKIVVKQSDIKIKQSAFSSNLRENLDDYKNIRDRFESNDLGVGFIEKKSDKKLRLTISMDGINGKNMGGMMGGNMVHEELESIEWEDSMKMMNKMSNARMTNWIMIDEDTGKENMEIEWNFKKNELVKVEIYNDPESMHPMQHPIHFHGQRFIVLSRDGKVNDNLQWKDTTLVKNGERVEILIEMTNPGIWMSHCHIAEHLQSGMMLLFKVEE